MCNYRAVTITDNYRRDAITGCVNKDDTRDNLRTEGCNIPFLLVPCRQ